MSDPSGVPQWLLWFIGFALAFLCCVFLWENDDPC